MTENNDTATKTAIKVRAAAGSMRGDAAVYHVSPPLAGNEFVVASAVDLGVAVEGYRSAETMIFPSDGHRVTDWGELAFVPHKSHADAFAQVGYEVTA